MGKNFESYLIEGVHFVVSERWCWDNNSCGVQGNCSTFATSLCPTLTEIVPPTASVSGGVQAMLYATQYFATGNYTVQIGSVELVDALYINSTAISFTVPSSPSAGFQTLTVYRNGGVYAVSSFGLLYYCMNQKLFVFSFLIFSLQ